MGKKAWIVVGVIAFLAYRARAKSLGEVATDSGGKVAGGVGNAWDKLSNFFGG